MSTAIGTDAPTFTLPDTDGAEHGVGTDESSPATLVVFTCNHCPYALAWHDRIVAVAEDYPDVKVLAVSSNDAERYPRDSFDAMRERVAGDGGWPMPYLYDESQEVARDYDAKTTPDCFVIDADGRIAYRGAPDADHQDPALNAAWLRDALDAVLAGEEPAQAETEPVGCSIKWRQ
jgi:peroxiredoxin